MREKKPRWFKIQYVERKVCECVEKATCIKALIKTVTDFQSSPECTYICKELVEGFRNYLVRMLHNEYKTLEIWRERLKMMKEQEA